ncbi:MAG: hydroxyacid dehydrogenase [Deltaproteobacteria bacterium]|nr:hydroxyacid dehydrogenase [Deltaproteobacteria bacterium]
MRPFVKDAVLAGGGVLVPVEQAEALVWVSPTGADELRALLDQHAQLRWVQLPWAGVEPFASLFDAKRVFTAGQGVYAEEVAEHALALSLAGLRDLKRRAQATAWQKPSGLSLLRGQVTLVGAGGIAQVLARLLAPFEVALTVVRRRDEPFPGAVRTLTLAQRHDAFASADVVILCCALTRETRGLVGRAELAAMRPHAWLVNVARGALIDTAALVEALAAGRIGGAALDVTDPEPLPTGHPLWSSERCLITPHVANTPEMAVPVLSRRVTENVRRFAAGAPLLGVVDVAAGY